MGRSSTSLLLAVVLAAPAVAGNLQSTSSSHASHEKLTVTCVAVNHPVDVFDAKEKAPVERDSWRVDCTVKVGEKLVWSGPLVLAEFATFRDAMLAIDEFRTKTAPKLARESK